MNITKKVYVTASRTAGTMGFDWYPTRELADEAFKEEAAEFDKNGDVLAYRFDVEVDPQMNRDDITAFIDDQIDELAEAAPIIYGNKDL